jgi:addiction module HigA family antidote
VSDSSTRPFVPAWACHPGEILHEEMEERGLSPPTLAAQLGWPEDNLRLYLFGLHPTTEAMAADLERVLGISARSWTNLQRGYDAWVLAKVARDDEPADDDFDGQDLRLMAADDMALAARMLRDTHAVLADHLRAETRGGDENPILRLQHLKEAEWMALEALWIALEAYDSLREATAGAGGGVDDRPGGTARVVPDAEGGGTA